MTTEVRILKPDGPDALVWESFYRRLPLGQRLVHFSPAYARAQKLGTSGEVLCAVASSGLDYAMQPFVLHTDGSRGFMESLYGYGGPVGTAPTYLALENRLVGFRTANRIVCERVVLAPSIAHKQIGIYGEIGIKPRHLKDVVVVTTNPEVLTTAGLTEKRLAAIRKAQRDGIRTRRTTSAGQALSRFYDLYTGTMDRVDAAPRWRLPRRYFEAYLGWDHAAIIEAVQNEIVVSSALVLVDGFEAHYQFAGNSGVSGASDLLIVEAAALARDCGCDTLDLGGGVTSEPDDTVFFYKPTFSEGRRPVYVVERIHDQVAFDAAAKDVPPTAFFPPWRAAA